MSRDVVLADCDGVSGSSTFDNADDAPSLEAAERSRLHDLDFVAGLCFVLLVMHMDNCLAVDDLMVERMRSLVRDGNLNGFVARAAGDETYECLARITRNGSDGGHGVGAVGAKGALSGNRGRFLLGGENGFEARNVFAVASEQMRLLYLSSVLAQAELK